MKKALTRTSRILLSTAIAAFLLSTLVGCASRKGQEGLGKEADRNHEELTAIIDQMPEADPNRTRLILLLEKMGRHRERCYRFEHAWKWVQTILATQELLANGISFELRAGGAADADAGP